MPTTTNQATTVAQEITANRLLAQPLIAAQLRDTSQELRWSVLTQSDLQTALVAKNDRNQVVNRRQYFYINGQITGRCNTPLGKIQTKVPA